jgi:caffeoyl-CoA O-methyltransferase
VPKYDDKLEQYIRKTFAKEDEIQTAARQACVDAGLPDIAVDPEEGRCLQILCRASGGSKVVEIGTLGACSAIWISRGLTKDGSLVTLEHDPERAEVARANLLMAGLSERVRLIVGDANDTLPNLSADGPYDMVFIDADKVSYPRYAEWAAENLRPGGILAYHNAFRDQMDLNEDCTPETRAILTLSQNLADDERFDATIFPAGYGTLVAVRTDA